MNERLRDAMNRAGLKPSDIAVALDVVPKTVERWITKGRVPYPKHMSALAALLSETENYLWPDALSEQRRAEVSESEVVKVYPHRSNVPAELWKRLIKEATEQVDILVFAGLYLAEEHGLAKKLHKRAAGGMPVRLLFGDPEGSRVRERGLEEGIGDAFGSRVENALAFYAPYADDSGLQIRLHDTTLYNSILRFDDEMLVNLHVHGLVGAQAPVLHLRQLGNGSLFETYMSSLEDIWENARTFEPAILAA